MKRSNAQTTDILGSQWSVAALIGIAMMCSASALAATAVAEPELLEAEKAFPVTARLIGDNTVELRYSIATGYYMYRDRFRFAINGQAVVLAKKAWPVGKMKDDATFGRVMTYRNSVRLLLPVAPAVAGAATGSQGSLTLTATSQGCADAGVCYPPLHQTLVFPSGSSAWASPQEAVVSGFSRDRSPGSGLTDRLTHGK